MHILITFNGQREPLELHSVKLIERVYNAIEITTFGNLPIRYSDVKHLDVIDWRDSLR